MTRIRFLGPEAHVPLLKSYIDEEVEFIAQEQHVPETVETRYDELVAGTYNVEQAIEAEKAGLDGVLISCFADPGLEGAREVVRIPVAAPCESSILFGLTLGRRITIIAPSDGAVPPTWDQVRRMGLDNHIVSIRHTNFSVERLHRAGDEAIEEAVREVKLAVAEDAAEVVIPGCTGFAAYSDEIAQRVPVPFIDPLKTALHMLLMTLRLGYIHSLLAYPPFESRNL